LERETSQKGFRINSAKIPIFLALKKIQDLMPHEEIVEADLNGIVNALHRDPILRHPIIADSNSGAVLDGTHRLAALSRLGCLTIPTALIDYQNPLVRIDQWYRVVEGMSAEHFRRELPLLATAMSPLDADRKLLNREGYASIRDNQSCFLYQSEMVSALDLCRKAYKLEEIGRNKGLKITYIDTEDTGRLAVNHFLMSTIRLEKREVIAGCRDHNLFPPKSTRHLIPSRPLGINTPLELLRDPQMQRAGGRFEQHLKSMKVKHLPEGSWVGSRRYMEEVFLFE
jgi:L-serine kinase (ADP)